MILKGIIKLKLSIMWRVLAILLVSGFVPALHAGSLETFNEANEAYKRSEYGYAIELYEKVLGEGFVSADLYYNLGNSYFKDNRMGPAILNYERALRLRPMDEDIHHNLSIARSRTIDRIEQRPLLFYERWWVGAMSLQNTDGWAITFLIMIVISLGLTAAYLFSKTVGIKKTAFYSLLLSFALSMLSITFAQKQFTKLNSKKEAVVMQARVTAKGSPSVQGIDLFLMHEGTRVNIRSTLGLWTEISLPNGSVGWIKNDVIEII